MMRLESRKTLASSESVIRRWEKKEERRKGKTREMTRGQMSEESDLRETHWQEVKRSLNHWGTVTSNAIMACEREKSKND